MSHYLERVLNLEGASGGAGCNKHVLKCNTKHTHHLRYESATEEPVFK